MIYLMDSNVFIEAKNRYYGFDLCPGFWSWMDQVFPAGKVGSITKVRDELVAGKDELAEWVKARKKLFLDVSDPATQKSFSEIAESIKQGDYIPGAKAHFLGKADPWLIAKARATSATIITHEMPVDASSTKIKIPNLCKKFDVPFMNTFDVLRHHKASFVLP